MELTVRNYRGAAKADIVLEKIALLCGKNASGKTSTLDAIRSVATASANPFKDVTKKEISMLVRSGTPAGFAKIKARENTSRIDWPKCEYTTNKNPIEISPVAAGITSLVDMNSPDRINYIVKMMNANPSADNLIDELISTGIFVGALDIKNTDFFKRLWEEIDVNGWDNAHRQVKEKGAKLKGAWENITGGQKYGKRIAETWIPDAWDATLDAEKESELQAKIDQAREWLEAAIKETSISDFEIEQLKEKAASLKKAEKELKAIDKQSSILVLEIAKKRDRRAELYSEKQEKIYNCPECKTQLSFSNGELINAPKIDKKTASAKKAEYEQLGKDLQSIEIQQNENLKNHGENRVQIKMAKEAVEKLKTIGESKSSENESKIEEIRIQLGLAETRFGAYKQFNNATETHKKIINNQKLCDILAPAGLRNKMLQDALKIINKFLKMLCDSVGWDLVELGSGCDIICNGVNCGRLIAKSERYRTRILLQLMVAMAEKSAFVIIDDLDELVKDVRNDMMKIIIKSTIPALMVCALVDLEDAPNLGAVGGVCYWIEKGIVKKV